MDQTFDETVEMMARGGEREAMAYKAACIEAGDKMIATCRGMGLEVQRMPGCIASFIVVNFLTVLGIDPEEAENELLQSEEADPNRDLSEYDKTKPLHVPGEHKNLKYRGNGLKRSKQWFQTEELDKLLIYLYTGFQYGVAHAQRHYSVVSVVEQMIDSLNKLFELNMNHAIFTLYRDGADCIGTHQDKVKTIGQEPNDFIIVVKLGKEGRPFTLSNLKKEGEKAFPEPFFEKIVEPGSLIVMSSYDNEKNVAHGVPAVEVCGQTSSVVCRNIKNKMTNEEFEKQNAKCQKAKRARDAKKEIERAAKRLKVENE